MKMFSSWFGLTAFRRMNGAANKSRRRKGRAMLHLEVLEDRWVPSTATGMNAGDIAGNIQSQSYLLNTPAMTSTSSQPAPPADSGFTTNSGSTMHSGGSKHSGSSMSSGFPLDVLNQMTADVQVALLNWSNPQYASALEQCFWMCYSMAASQSPAQATALAWDEFGLMGDVLLAGSNPQLLVNNPQAISLANAIHDNPLSNMMVGSMMANIEMELLVIRCCSTMGGPSGMGGMGMGGMGMGGMGMGGSSGTSGGSGTSGSTPSSGFPLDVLSQITADVQALPNWSNPQSAATLESVFWASYSFASTQSSAQATALAWDELGLAWDLRLAGNNPQQLVNDQQAISLANLIHDNPLYSPLIGSIMANAEMERLLVG